MKIQVFPIRPFFNIDAYFINRTNEPTFDPKHPVVYPGDEVVKVETLTGTEAIAKYSYDDLKGPDVLYTIKNSGLSKNQMRITIWEKTGKTSADIVQENR